jgi:hypothetical protein
MASLTVEDVSGKTLSALRTRARANNRTLNGEVLFIFDWIADHGFDYPTMARRSIDPDVERQKREMEQLIGSWDDSRTTAEIISEIVDSRTTGREVAL